MRGLTWLCGLAQGFHAPAERQVLETLQRFGFICAALCRLRRKKVKKRPFNLWFSFVEFQGFILKTLLQYIKELEKVQG